MSTPFKFDLFGDFNTRLQASLKEFANLSIINNSGTVNVNMDNVKTHTHKPTDFSKDSHSFMWFGKVINSEDKLTFKNNDKVYLIRNMKPDMASTNVG